MSKKKPKVVVLGVLDEHEEERGLVSVTADSHFGLDFQAGKFEAALKHLQKIYEVTDDPKIVGSVIDFLRDNEWDFIENASVLYDVETQTEVRRVVRLRHGASTSETVGFLSYSGGQISGIKPRLEDAIPVAAKESYSQNNESDKSSPTLSMDTSRSRKKKPR